MSITIHYSVNDLVNYISAIHWRTENCFIGDVVQYFFQFGMGFQDVVDSQILSIRMLIKDFTDKYRTN